MHPLRPPHRAILLLLVLASLRTPASGSKVGAGTACSDDLGFRRLVVSGELLLQQGRPSEAAACFQMAADKGGGDAADAFILLGDAYEAQGLQQMAFEAFSRAAGAAQGGRGAAALARRRLGLIMEEGGQALQALEMYREALGHAPADPQLWYSAGYVHLTLGQRAAATQHFATALMLTRGALPIASEGMGSVHFAEGRLRAAAAYFQRALALQPNRLQAAANVASALGKLATDEDSAYLTRAASAYDAVLALDPSNADAAAKVMLIRKHLCDWRTYDADFQRLVAATVGQIGRGERLALVPFNALTLAWALPDLLEINRRHAAPHTPLPPPPPEPRTPRETRVGFLSADMRDHPVGRDLAVIFRALAPAHRVYAFAINRPAPGRGADAAWQASLQVHVAKFVFVGEASEEEAARTIWGEGLHVLVDVMGYTRGNRRGVLGHQPAPVQVAFKGYMSTTGAAYLSLATDAVSTPPEMRGAYAEPFAYVPGTFFISGHAVNHANVLEGTWASYGDSVGGWVRRIGVPADKFVFCSFNALYKVDSVVFRLWMDVVKSTRGRAVLWLPNEPPEAREHLCREAEAIGVTCGSLVFTDQVPFDVHIQVKSRCDLALDTPLYNSHGTAADLLWGAVPLLTMPREGMAARLAASILHAIGFGELIAPSLEEYARMANLLAQRPAKLRGLRERLERARHSWALHDHEGWARRFSRVLGLLVDAHAQGHAAFNVAAAS